MRVVFDTIYFGRCLALAIILSGIANRPRFSCYSQLPTEVISVSIWLPVSSVLSACYCPDRHCVLKSLVTPEKSSASTIDYMHTSLLRATSGMYQETEDAIDGFA
jgi:hypothetical protein